MKGRRIGREAGFLAGMSGGNAAKLARAGGAVGIAAAVVVGTAEAFVKARAAVANWTEAAMESARRLSHVSGSMAAVMAQRDVQDMMRDVKRGEATGGTAQKLMQAEARRKDEEVKIQIAMDNLRNEVLTLANNLFTTFLKPIATGVEFIAKTLGLDSEEPEAVGLGGLADDAIKAGKAIEASGKKLMDIAAEAAAKFGTGVAGPVGGVAFKVGPLP